MKEDPSESKKGKRRKDDDDTPEVKVIDVGLGPCGDAILRLSADRKRLHVEFKVDVNGFDKSGLNGLIDALKKVRDKMNR